MNSFLLEKHVLHLMFSDQIDMIYPTEIIESPNSNRKEGLALPPYRMQDCIVQIKASHLMTTLTTNQLTVSPLL